MKKFKTDQGKIASQNGVLLKPVHDGADIIIPPCRGEERITTSGNLYCVRDFDFIGGFSDPPTNEVSVKLCDCEVLKEVDLLTFFLSVNKNLFDLCLTQSQFLRFLGDNEKHFTSFGFTLFLYLSKRLDQIYVIRILKPLKDKRLNIDYLGLASSYKWGRNTHLPLSEQERPKHRILIPF